MNNIIIDLLLYFAQFPDHNGVLKLFNKGRSEIAGYEDLRTRIEGITQDPVLPEVKNFVFGSNFDAVKVYIAQLSGFYMFIDYGEIDSENVQPNKISDSFRVAVTIACKTSEFSGDLIDQALISDQAFGYLMRMRNLMIQNQRERYSFKDISSSHSIVPFVSREFDSIGWTLMFNRTGFDMFNAKKRYFSEDE